MKTTRREFLTHALGASAVMALGGTVPGFLRSAAAGDDDSGKNTVLVVLQLTGGNDGLNTVVPYRNDDYHRARPKLGLGTKDVLRIDDDLGFHPSLGGLAKLLESGRLAVVQGVGYAQPNRSHFESMDIWHSGRRKSRTPRREGWLGKALDGAGSEAGGDVPALHLGGEEQPLALAASRVRVPSIRSLERFRLQTGGRRDLERAIADLVSAKASADDDLLRFVRSSARSALAASERVEKAGRGYRPKAEYPDTPLAAKLGTIARLVDAGLSTRAYYVALDGFDTHARQDAAHRGLLRQFGDAVHAFVEDVASHGHGDRVLMMAFSEFGRRVAENASAGTDHGAAGPMILAGTRVRAGTIGPHPGLTDLEGGDLRHHTDFRCVYAAVLENWLGWPSAPALGGTYRPLGVLRG